MIELPPLPDGTIRWSLDGDEACGYNNWLGETPFGRILITWKGWKEYHDACVDEFPGGFQAYGGPNDVKAACEREFTPTRCAPTLQRVCWQSGRRARKDVSRSRRTICQCRRHGKLQSGAPPPSAHASYTP
jgi:hypothetical protein